MAQKKGAPADTSKVTARTNRMKERKERNRAANEARHQANLDAVRAAGISGKTVEKTKTTTDRKGNAYTKTVTKAQRPSKLLRAAKRQGLSQKSA